MGPCKSNAVVILLLKLLSSFEKLLFPFRTERDLIKNHYLYASTIVYYIYPAFDKIISRASMTVEKDLLCKVIKQKIIMWSIEVQLQNPWIYTSHDTVESPQ